MPLTNCAADAFGSVTIALFALFTLFSLFCIFCSVYFHIRIGNVGFHQLGFFNGPWITRTALVSISIWWGIWEILRLSFFKVRFSSTAWQRGICKIYVVANLGFAEPFAFLAVAYLLHGSLQKREQGPLNHRWNLKAVAYVLSFCSPVVLLQALFVFISPMLASAGEEKRRMAVFFTRTSYLDGDHDICTYPLFSTIFLGVVYVLFMCYISYAGSRVLNAVINKALRRRASWLMISVLIFLPARALLLGFSVLLTPGTAHYELFGFLSFLMMFLCMSVLIWILVYCPVSDSLALEDPTTRGMTEMVPYDDYYNDDTSLIANQSFRDPERCSETSTKPGSISFRTMIKDDQIDGASFCSHSPLTIVSPSGSPSTSATKPMLPLREVPRY